MVNYVVVIMAIFFSIKSHKSLSCSFFFLPRFAVFTKGNCHSRGNINCDKKNKNIGRIFNITEIIIFMATKDSTTLKKRRRTAHTARHPSRQTGGRGEACKLQGFRCQLATKSEVPTQCAAQNRAGEGDTR